MQRDEIRNLIREELAVIVRKPDLELTDATTAKDIKGWDSFNHLKLLFTLETKLGLHFEVHDISDPTDTGDLVDLIQRKLAEA